MSRAAPRQKSDHRLHRHRFGPVPPERCHALLRFSCSGCGGRWRPIHRARRDEMAYDDRRDDMERERAQRERDQWRHQRGPRPERLGDRNARGLSDDPDYGSERYGFGATQGYGSEGAAGPMSSDPDGFFSAPGFDPSFGGPRFDRADVGSTGTHGVHPVSSAFGAGYGAGYGAGAGGFQSSARMFASMGRGGGAGGGQHDRQYSEWRSRQMEQLDRDYDDYCREKQSRFDTEFGAWRERRGKQRRAIGRAGEHMEVVGSDGSHVGTVDKVRGDSLILTRSDPEAGGIHHSIPCSWIETVDDKVCLNLTAEEARNRWREEQGGQALFERPASASTMSEENRSRNLSGADRRHD
jgi:hypothetical protein